jgi:hypothetical protein
LGQPEDNLEALELIMHTRIKSLRVGLVPAIFLACAAVAIFAARAKSQSLGSAETFGVRAASTATNTGASQVSGNAEPWKIRSDSGGPKIF